MHCAEHSDPTHWAAGLSSTAFYLDRVVIGGGLVVGCVHQVLHLPSATVHALACRTVGLRRQEGAALRHWGFEP